MAIIRIIMLVLAVIAITPSFGQVTSDVKDIQVAKQRLRIGNDTSEYFTSIVRVISLAATHRQSPTAKAVYDYCQTILTNLSFSGASSPITLNAPGTDVTFTAGTGISMSATTGNMTITNTGDTNPSDDITGSGTTNYVSKFTSAKIIGNSQVFDNGTNVGINTATPSQRLDVNGGLMLRYATVNPDTVNGWLTLGGINTLAGSSGGSVIGPLSSFNANINRPIRTLILQGASDGNGEGISFVTGSAKSERLNIGRNGTYLFNALSGTGNRFPVLDASGFLTRGTVDPASLVLGNGSANQVTYYTAPQSITSSANFTFNGTNIGMGGLASPLHRLDVNGGNINIRYNNAAAPNTGSEWLTLGSYNSLPTGQAANHIYSGSGSGTILGTPIGGLFLQGRSDNNTFSNIYFVTGSTPVMKQTIASDGVYFNSSFRGGSASFIAGWNSSGKSSDVNIGAGLSFASGTLTAIDQSATNEIQNLSLAGQALGISGGTGVTLPVVGVSAGTGISVATASGVATVTNTGDLSATNEGALTVTAGTSTNSIISSNTSGSTPVTLVAGNGLNITETGNTIIMGLNGGNDAWVYGGNSPGATRSIGTNDGSALDIETNGLTRVRILPDGKIGVNTTVPNVTMDFGESTDGIALPGGVAGQRVAIGRVLRYNSDFNGIETSNQFGTYTPIVGNSGITVTTGTAVAGTGVTLTTSRADITGVICSVKCGNTPSANGVIVNLEWTSGTYNRAPVFSITPGGQQSAGLQFWTSYSGPNQVSIHVGGTLVSGLIYPLVININP